MRRALLLVALLLAGCTSPDPGQDTTPSPATQAPTSGETPSPQPTPLPTTAPTAMTPPTRPPPGRFPGCTGSGPVSFNNSPMRAEDFLMIKPYGMVVGAHVTPIDHVYFSPAPSSRDQFEVRAVADGVIYEMGPRDVMVDTNQPRAREWRMDIAHTCTFTSYFDLLTSLDPEIEAAYNATRHSDWRGIPVRAGQVVGRIGGQTLDFGVYDYNATLPGFVRPESYAREPWKVHTIDAFAYFPPDVRDALLAKNVRTASPRSGKIDHDVDGRLAGNWFAQGTNGYAGDGRWDYWEGHLSIAPDYIDPNATIISVGNYSGTPRQFAMRSGAPSPANVSVETGVVKYDLLSYSHVEKDNPWRSGFSPSGIRVGHEVVVLPADLSLGTLVVQLLEPRVLKAEVVVGKSSDQVGGFTSAARLYER